MVGVWGLSHLKHRKKIKHIAYSYIFILHKAIPCLSFFTDSNYYVGGITLLHAQAYLTFNYFPGCFVYPDNKNVFFQKLMNGLIL